MKLKAGTRAAVVNAPAGYLKDLAPPPRPAKGAPAAVVELRGFDERMMLVENERWLH
jgi:hypothetical protein